MFINNNINVFLKSIKKYTLNEDIATIIIKSNNIKDKYKNRIINTIDISFINDIAMEYITEKYNKNQIKKISEELKEKIFKSNIKEKYKLLIFEKEVEKNNSIELISKYLKLLPGKYKYIGDYKSYSTRFSINKTKTTENVIENLEKIGFKFDKEISKNKIWIRNRK